MKAQPSVSHYPWKTIRQVGLIIETQESVDDNLRSYRNARDFIPYSIALSNNVTTRLNNCISLTDTIHLGTVRN